MSSPYTMIGSDGREYSGSLEEFREWAQEGRLGPATLVWSEADERWLWLRRVMSWSGICLVRNSSPKHRYRRWFFTELGLCPVLSPSWPTGW